MKTIVRMIVVAASLMAATSLFAQADSSGIAHSLVAVPTETQKDIDAAKAAEIRALSAQAADRLLSSRIGTSPGPVLVVPAGEMSVETLAAANEDMNVMSRIIASTLRQGGMTPSGRDSRLLSDIPSLGSLSWAGSTITSNIDAIYLQGYGVLFTMKVGFPLSPGPDSNQPQEQPAKTGGDAVWTQTRQELFEPQVEPARPSAAGEQKYSAERVENLKTAIITVLKHAANIRGLQPGESVIVTVIGQGSRRTIISVMKGSDGVTAVDSAGRRYKIPLLENLSDLDLTPPPPIALTIRAKLSDVAAFAKGDLSLDQFRQKVQVLTCPYLGEKTDSSVRMRIPAPPPPVPPPLALPASK